MILSLDGSSFRHYLGDCLMLRKWIFEVKPLLAARNFMQATSWTSRKQINTCGQPVLEMFTKENCSLCDEAKDNLKPYKHLFTLKEVDITLAKNKMWFDKYRYDIPVFHMEGQYLMRHKVHEGLLQKKLDEFYGTKSK